MCWCAVKKLLTQSIYIICEHVVLYRLCCLATFNQMSVFNGRSHCCRTDPCNASSIPTKEYLFTDWIIFTYITSEFTRLGLLNFCAKLIIFLGNIVENKNGYFYYWNTVYVLMCCLLRNYSLTHLHGSYAEQAPCRPRNYRMCPPDPFSGRMV